ncbi:hypothetical protein ES332_A06G068200v1 [Gossypium tomentosum]|uniref:Uncharacterized protein n=1 Tax=Gossypium tomentosum TaxID=34277 RepID=A0A5D2Q2U4_GOSTO|nr:hypothetical protein ES332_A06G068200v1 [Gossypium tomentosum]
MAVKKVTTRIQKELGIMEGEFTQLQVKFTQLDARIDARLNDFQEGIKSEVRSKIRSELYSLFEQYSGQSPLVTVTGVMIGKGKGILGAPPGFLIKEHLVVSHIPDLGHSSMSLRGGTLEVGNTSFRVNCPHFYGGNFRGW